MPDEEEITMLNEFYQDALAKIKKKEIMPEEYLSIGNHKIEEKENIPKEKLAALSLTAHLILNLDETIIRG